MDKEDPGRRGGGRLPYPPPRLCAFGLSAAATPGPAVCPGPGGLPLGKLGHAVRTGAWRPVRCPEVVPQGEVG
jgi:hypothetical protein